MRAALGPVFVAGIPRSGTTWAGNVLGRAGELAVVHEPDNEKEYLSALVAKRGLGRFPVLAPDDDAPAYERLWRLSLAGVPADSATLRARVGARLWRTASVADRELALRGQSTVRSAVASRVIGARTGSAPAVSPSVVVKSVHAALSLDWLAERFPELRVVVVLRHPANVLSSWLEMSLPDQDRRLDAHPAVRRNYTQPWQVPLPAPEATAVERAAWQVCLLTAAVVEAAKRRPDWLVTQHEELCEDPVRHFTALSGALGLGWTDAAERFVRESDRPGSGFTLQRRAQEQVNRWRTRLGVEGITALRGAAVYFPGLEQWHDDLRDPARAQPST